MCAGGNIMEKTLTEATQLLQRLRSGWPCKEIGKNIFRVALSKKLMWRYLLEFLQKSPGNEERRNKASKD
jgi:hypothetical protein